MLNVKPYNLSKKNLTYEPNPPFGSVHVPVVLWFDLEKNQGTPSVVNIEALKNMDISPFCSTLHYGQSIFEGLKTYKLDHNEVGIFRPQMHAKRFSKSSEKMSMASFSPELFLESVFEYVKAVKDYVPKEKGHSLYLRPLLFANEPIIKVKPSTSYRFVIMSSIVGPYFKKNQRGSRVLINKSFIRAFPGGTGEAKTSSNYALSLSGLEYAQSKDFDQVLYVDALKKEKIEELGGMNFFMVKDGELVTPKLDGQILHGVTRQSIIEISKKLGIKCVQRDVLLSELTSGKVNEVFATGTAASIAPLSEIGVQESIAHEITVHKFERHDVAKKLLEYLTNTQIGKTEMSKDWLLRV